MSSSDEDPVVRSARREAAVTLTLFAVALAYSVGYCVRYGYGRPVESLSFVLGFPAWVFWGLLVPWGVCTLLGCWLSFVFIQDAPLEEAAAPPDASAEAGEVPRD